MDKNLSVEQRIARYLEASFTGDLLPRMGRGIRKYSLTALVVGAIELGCLLGGCATEKEKLGPKQKITYMESSVQKEPINQQETLTKKEDVKEETQHYKNTKIAFASNKEGNYEIYVMDYVVETYIGRNHLKRLTDNPTDDKEPSWSPNGKKIAYASDKGGTAGFEIYVIDADGNNPKNLTNNSVDDNDPSWSPDGNRIAFSSWRDGNAPEIYVMNSDGSEQRRLTNNATYDSDPSWSPDGEQIIFVSEGDKFYNSLEHLKKLFDRGGDQEIYVIDAEGSNQKRLTVNTARDETPSWSPDGSKIVFVSDRDGSKQIYTMNPDGSGQTRLTHDNFDNKFPSWSPDGQRILFSSSQTVYLETQGGLFNYIPLRAISSRIFVMDTNGSNQQRVIGYYKGIASSTARWNPRTGKVTGKIIEMWDDNIAPRLEYNFNDITPSWSPFLKEGGIAGRK